ncbi:MAG: hypothetical protein JWR26_2818 [Pedosphaera sp.]|nr:hypothetical protein [Pedosphaera sp.]
MGACEGRSWLSCHIYMHPLLRLERGELGEQDWVKRLSTSCRLWKTMPHGAGAWWNGGGFWRNGVSVVSAWALRKRAEIIMRAKEMSSN